MFIVSETLFLIGTDQIIARESNLFKDMHNRAPIWEWQKRDRSANFYSVNVSE